MPKLRKGEYVPFFISERKRSEQALIGLIQEVKLFSADGTVLGAE